ncbi:MAG: hypothetical protein KC912_12515 [Proteobacteria bacterium]|nr:hypothetical protein [Pseudomonadota bacterium]
MRAIRCKGCGGAVAVRPGEKLPACLFCGSPASDLVEEEVEQVEQPELFAPFAVEQDTADTAFRKFTKSSIWYPSDLKRARLELKRLLVPAWAFGGRIEVHWTGLERASNRAGKRPVAGNETVDIEQVLVTASRSLRQAELFRLGAFDEGKLEPFSREEASAPFELSEMSRSAAKERAIGAMEDHRKRSIQNQHGLLLVRASTILHHIAGRPVLVPIWIGAYRYNDVVYRILVHGQTGALVGKAPKSLWKMLGAGLLALMLLGFIAMCVLGGGGFAALIGSQ